MVTIVSAFSPRAEARQRWRDGAHEVELAHALESTDGNQSEAARRLGVSRVTLIDKMKKYHLGQKR